MGDRDYIYDYYYEMDIRDRDRGIYYNKYSYNDSHRYESPGPLVGHQGKLHGIIKRSRCRSRS